MKKIFMLLVACVAMVFVSCSKDDDGDNETLFGGKQVSKIIYKTANGEVYSHVTYEYDKSGRVVTEIWREEGENDIYKYTYGANKITVDNEYDGDTYSTDYYLENGIITYSMGDENATYTYNDKKELIKVIDDTYTYVYTWTNGNITTQNLSQYGVFEYSYSKNAIKTLGLNNFEEDIPNNILFCYGYFGAKNANLMSGYTWGTKEKYDYEYEFDRNGNVTSMKEYNIEDGTRKLEKTVTVEYK